MAHRLCKDMTTTAVESTDGKVGEYFNWTLADENGKPMKKYPYENRIQRCSL